MRRGKQAACAPASLAALPAPRKVRHKPYIQWQAPLVWTTLSLTLHADGTAETTMTGASRFPRHWVYSDTGALTHKSGLTDFRLLQNAAA